MRRCCVYKIILFILNKLLNRKKKDDEDSSWEQLLTDSSSRIWSSQEEGEQEDNIHKNFLDNLLSCMPLIANFTTRGFHENCLINGKSASVCKEIVFLKTSRFVLSLCGYLTLVVVQLKSFIFRCQIFRYGVILDFRQVGETRDTTRGC